MTQKRSNLHKLLIALVCILVIAVGCNRAQDQTPLPNQSQNQNQNMSPNQTEMPNVPNAPGTPSTPTENKALDTDLTNQIQQEKDVAGGNIYEKNGIIIGSIVLKDNEDAAYAKQLADKYLEKLKTKYPGKRINVQVVGNGKNLANIDYKP